MATPSICLALRLVFVATMLPGLAFAQAITTPPNAASSSDESPILLSPFAVRSERDTGYQASTTLPDDERFNQRPAVDRPFYAPAETNADATIAYGRKIWRDKIDWKATLQVRNIWSPGEDLIPVTVQPTGEVASYRLAPERRVYLTDTFSF